METFIGSFRRIVEGHISGRRSQKLFQITSLLKQVHENLASMELFPVEFGWRQSTTYVSGFSSKILFYVV